MLVVALVQDALGRARVVEALRDRAGVRFCDTCDELRTLAYTAGVGAAIIEPTDRTGCKTWPVLAAIREGFPSLPLIAYCPIRPSLSHDIVAMVRAGATSLLIYGVDDTVQRLRATLARARGTSTASWAGQELGALVPSAMWPAIEYCLENASRSLTVQEMAGALGLHRKTLANRFVRAGLPAPSAFIVWSRLLLAGVLLEDKGRKLEHIALELDFPSAGALRAMLNRYTRLKPGEVRENGGGRCILGAFKQALRKSRRDWLRAAVPAGLRADLVPIPPPEDRPRRRERVDTLAIESHMRRDLERQRLQRLNQG